MFVYKIVEVIRAAPRFFTEFYLVDFEQRTKERLGLHIFRQVTTTRNFAVLPSQDDTNGFERQNFIKAVRNQKVTTKEKLTHLQNE